ncbi:hypothetical protein [Neisseria subflava]|uniref:hypothetical protein n=1 Tax=Neisseria subflava TaxID=28449 RepID=UPI00280BCA45|nr:hypothetical protein [Neisseria subflava]
MKRLFFYLYDLNVCFKRKSRSRPCVPISTQGRLKIFRRPLFMLEWHKNPLYRPISTEYGASIRIG